MAPIRIDITRTVFFLIYGAAKVTTFGLPGLPKSGKKVPKSENSTQPVAGGNGGWGSDVDGGRWPASAFPVNNQLFIFLFKAIVDVRRQLVTIKMAKDGPRMGAFNISEGEL